MSDSFNGSDPSESKDPSGQGTSFGAASTDGQSSGGEEGVLKLNEEQVAALVKRDNHAQDHIKTLESETQKYKDEIEDLRRKADSALTADELLEKLGNRGEGQEIDLDALVAKATQSVTDSLANKQVQQAQSDNFKKVSNEVQAQFGDKADVEMRKVAAENSMSFDDIVDLAHKNPNLVLKLCNLKVIPNAQPSVGDIQTGQYHQQQEPVKVNVMNLRTDKERIADFQRRLAEHTQ